jgi:ribosomal protein L37AE/L43A
MSTARAVPFYCPYCGDEDLRPVGDSHGVWWCQSCRRAWQLSMIGTGTPENLAAPDRGRIVSVLSL